MIVPELVSSASTAQEFAQAETTPTVIARTPATTITAQDIALARVYVPQFMTAAVQGQRVNPGSIFAATDKDDPEPQVAPRGGTGMNTANRDGHVFCMSTAARTAC